LYYWSIRLKYLPLLTIPHSKAGFHHGLIVIVRENGKKEQFIAKELTMKKLLLTSVVLLMAANLGYAQDYTLKGKADLTFTSKYIWRGFEVAGDKTATHASVDLLNPETGLGFNVTGHIVNGSGHIAPGVSAVDYGQRWDYSLYYLGKLFEKDPLEIDYRLAYVYYNYPRISAHKSCEAADLQEINAVMSLPNALGVTDLVPSYALVKLWPNGSRTYVGAKSPSGGTASGFAHIFMLDYALPYTCPLTNVDRKLNLHSELVYNDGVGPNGANVDHDWSNLVIGASTDFQIYQVDKNFCLTPGIYQQISMDKSVNKDNETWMSLSASYKF
jgi:hypothetical protein